jgi:hypothetical protein
MKRLEASAAMLKQRAEEFATAARTLENTQKRMKERIKTAMQVMQVSELRGHDVVYKLSQSAPKIVIDQDALPIEYIKTTVTYEADKEKISDHIKSGISIDGVSIQDVSRLTVSVNKGV